MAVCGVAHGAATTTGTIRPILTSAFHLKPRALWQTQIERTHHTHFPFDFLNLLSFMLWLTIRLSVASNLEWVTSNSVEVIIWNQLNAHTNEWELECANARARAHMTIEHGKSGWCSSTLFFFSREMLRNYISFVPYISDNCSYFIGSYGRLINQCNQIFNRLKCIMLFNK